MLKSLIVHNWLIYTYSMSQKAEYEWENKIWWIAMENYYLNYLDMTSLIVNMDVFQISVCDLIQICQFTKLTNILIIDK